MKVKVPVRVVIESLTKRLDESKANAEKNAEVEKQFQEDMKKWTQDFVAQHQAVLKVESVNYRRWQNRVDVEYEIPEGAEIKAQPTRDSLKTLHSWEIEEIENAIRILKLTEDEYVSASTMKQIGRFI